MSFQFNASAVLIAPVKSTGFVGKPITPVAEKSASEGAPDIITAEQLVGSPLEKWGCDAVSLNAAVDMLNSVWNDETQAKFDALHPNGYKTGKGVVIPRIMVSQGKIDYNAVASATNLKQTPDCTIRQFKLSEDAKGRYLNADDVRAWALYRVENALVRPGDIFKGRGKGKVAE